MKTFTDPFDGRTYPVATPGQSRATDAQRLAVMARELGCKACAFWQKVNPFPPPEEDESEIGLCRAHSPRPIIDLDSEVCRWELTWPQTTPADWCGEFLPGPGEPSKENPDE